MSNRDKLRALIDANYGGVQAAFARAIHRQPSQINQWLSGHRDLDIKGQQIIEKALGLPGYFSGATTVQQPVAAYQSDITDDERQLIFAMRELRPTRAALLRAQVFDELDRKPDDPPKGLRAG